jgi:hypothetical protein
VRRSSAIVTVACLAGLFAGCSSEKTGTVTGKVTLNGKPVSGGTISFQAKSGGVPVTAFIAPDGTYRVELVPAGEVLIGVWSAPSEGAARGEVIKKSGSAPPEGGGAKAPPPPEAPSAAPAADKLEIPARYSDPGASGLTATVREGENTHEVTLTK